VSELGYREMFEKDLFEDELLGEYVKDKLIYYPTVTREPFRNEGRMTDLMKSGKLFQDIGLPPINPSDDRAMICGSPSMNKDVAALLDEFGLKPSPRMGGTGDYVVERAFVEQ
ncbi:MAG TPA: ferredoxin--NADP(+) reductase, partial [Moraxellaceae bacterium]|nr:ferredoxin--NADP(+) reductase [Moraxellaceae bacterium]